MSDEVIVMGNGIIGSLTSIKLAEAGLDVRLVGPMDRNGSASTAAGAMINVYGEVDKPLDDYAIRKLELGHKGTKMWRAMLPPEIFTAERTEVYVDEGCSDLELAAFNSISKAAGSLISQEENTGRMHIPLPDEPAVDTKLLFRWLDRELRRLGVKSVAGTTASPHDKYVYCTGAATVPHIKTLPVFYGVGTAMLVDAQIDIPKRTVMRTPNRGNTCGMHIVPRDSGFYVGAGSFISKTPTYGYRLETIQYLAKCLADDFGVDVWQMGIEPVKGYRPMSFDGKPMLGPLEANPNTYVATGTKRDGLTYAPCIADDIVDWATGKRSGVFDGWEPDRKPICYGEDSLDDYIKNRQAALQAHGRDITEVAATEEWMTATENAVLDLGVSENITLHPEIIGVLL